MHKLLVMSLVPLHNTKFINGCLCQVAEYFIRTVTDAVNYVSGDVTHSSVLNAVIAFSDTLGTMAVLEILGSHSGCNVEIPQ